MGGTVGWGGVGVRVDLREAGVERLDMTGWGVAGVDGLEAAAAETGTGTGTDAGGVGAAGFRASARASRAAAGISAGFGEK